MSEISFGNIVLANSGKKGVLKPNSDGIYRLNAGGFNIPNHAGIVYPANKYIREQMEANSDLNRRVSMGYCLMEQEHPQPFFYVEENGVRYRKAMTSVLEWINRLRSYDHDNVCGLISKIIFRPENPNNLSAPIWNEIDCKPFGAKAEWFRESLETPEHNTAVSIRTQISPFKPGETRKEVVYWSGYDAVSEPGFLHANKHMSAGCESMLSDFNLGLDNVIKFKASDVIEQIDNQLVLAANSDFELQRVGGLESLNMMREMLAAVKRDYRSSETTRIGVSFGDVF